DPTQRRVDVALERGTLPERDKRDAMGGADAHDPLHVLGGLGIDDGVRRLVDDPGQRIAVLLAHGLRGDDAVAESRGQLRDRFGDDRRVAAKLFVLLRYFRDGHSPVSSALALTRTLA